MAVALEAHGVGKRYRRGRPWALRDVDLAIPEGSITALVGPNGAGKSTLIKGYVGFERPTAGRLLIDGIDPWRDRGGAIRRIGYVPQAASLYRELSVSDHLALAARWREGFDRVAAELRLGQLDIPLDARADELSGGQQAQVGLAIALGTRAPVLLLDEPLASLDPLARREFLHVMVEAVREAGATALLSSHVITDIEQACDRLLVLGGGRTLLDVSIAEARAAHRVVDDGGPLDAGAGGWLDTGGPLDTGAGGRLVGRFPDEEGKLVSLIEAPGGPGRPATLEEVVLGHLAAGRTGVRTASGATGTVAA